MDFRVTCALALGIATLSGTACSREKPAPEPPAPPATTSSPTQAADTAPAAPAPTATTPAPAAAPPPVAAAPVRPKPRPKPEPKPAAPEPAESAAAAQPPGPVADPYHPAPRDTLDMDTYQGWKQFELNCARCHGEYAVGTSFAPSLVVSLKDGGTIPTKEAFVTVVCAGRPDKGMPGWCALGLEMDKIQQIYQYARGRADGRISAGRPALVQ